MVFDSIKKLVTYALEKELIKKEDVIWCTNSLLSLLGLDEYEETQATYHDVDLESTLNELLDYAYEHQLLAENTVVYRDLFDTKLMSVFVDRPAHISAKFHELYQTSPKAATDWFYRFALDSDYVRAYRIKKDLKWQTTTPYGDLDITINLAKPEKDPKAIAAALKLKQSSYPLCQLCPTNEGYAGRLNHPARETIRLIPLSFDEEAYFFQYSPYSYFNEHCIVLNKKHLPMVIDKDSLEHLVDFTKKFPHYILGSNADLPIVGGSILTHDHYQGGAYIFPMFRAPVYRELKFKGFDQVQAGHVKWPLADIRLISADPVQLVALADKIRLTWQTYSDKKAAILAETNGERHNTITPIAHRIGNTYALEIVLRNNLTTKEYPQGLYHPHPELWHIKKENIGLIEVMGLAVLPARLFSELTKIEAQLVQGSDPERDSDTAKHATWIKEIKTRYANISANNVREIVEKETGLVFAKCLEDAGVYKQTKEGDEAFSKFIDAVNSKTVS